MIRTLRCLALLAALVAVSGCASRWLVDSEVRSHSTLQDFTPGAAYRFERLPSQQATERSRAAQANLEAMAAPALQAAGLRHDAANARYSVELSARTTRQLAPGYDPWFDGPWGPWGWGPGGYGGWYGHGLPPQTWYLREVSVVLRQLPGRDVVYETRARHDGPYNRGGAIWPVMFQAALQGFPTPPAGVRRVDIELRPAAAPAPAPAPGAAPAQAPAQTLPAPR